MADEAQIHHVQYHIHHPPRKPPSPPTSPHLAPRTAHTPLPYLGGGLNTRAAPTLRAFPRWSLGAAVDCLRAWWFGTWVGGIEGFEPVVRDSVIGKAGSDEHRFVETVLRGD